MTNAKDDTELSRPKISGLLDQLRSKGFMIGVDQYINAEVLLRDMAVAGVIRDSVHLGNVLSAIIAKSPEQQETFRREFDNWWITNAKPKKLETLQKLSDSERVAEIKGPAWRNTCVGLFLIAVAVFVWYVGIVSDVSNPSILGTKPKSTLYFILLVPIILVFVSMGGYLAYRGVRTLRFVRHHGRHESLLYDLDVGDLTLEIAPEPEMRKIAQALGLYLKVGSLRLDPDRTADASARSGVPIVVYADLLREPEFLVLIDVASQEDHLLALARVYCERLAANGLVIRTFHFRGDPSRVTGPDGRQLMLVSLLAKTNEQRLIIVSDASGFSTETGLPSWINATSEIANKALFTPLPRAVWSAHETKLRDVGYYIDIASADGFYRFAQTFNNAQQNFVSHLNGSPYPTILRERTYRWLDDMPPTADQTEALIAQLKNYLGTSGYRWLTATAVFPSLLMPITLYLREVVGGNMRELPSLVSLPWFRKGRIPDWMRLRLIDDLDQHHSQALREKMRTMFVPLQELENSSRFLEIAVTKPLGILNFQLWDSAVNSSTNEYIFLEFMAGRKINVLAPAAPAHIHTLLRARLPNAFSPSAEADVSKKNLEKYVGSVTISFDELPSIQLLPIKQVDDVGLLERLFLATRRRQFILSEDWQVMISGIKYLDELNGTIAIPPRNNFDGASLPLPSLVSFLTVGIFRPLGVTLIASVIHEYLYQHGTLRVAKDGIEYQTIHVPRHKADLLFRDIVGTMIGIPFVGYIGWFIARIGWLWVRYDRKRFGGTKPLAEYVLFAMMLAVIYWLYSLFGLGLFLTIFLLIHVLFYLFFSLLNALGRYGQHS